jgi:hypothetical protein
VATVSHFWCEPLGYVSHAPLGLSFNGSLWFRRQLQNGRLLALKQSCQERDPAIRKFQRIVMRRNLLLVDLPEDRCLVLDYFIAPSYQTQTAMFMSSAAANPRVPVPKLCVVSLSPTFAGRDLTLWRL